MSSNYSRQKEEISLLEVRSVDEVGRVIIPRGLRLKYDINSGDEIAFFDGGNGIGLRKYRASCCVCGSLEGLNEVGEKFICQCCTTRIAIRV